MAQRVVDFSGHALALFQVEQLQKRGGKVNKLYM